MGRIRPVATVQGPRGGAEGRLGHGLVARSSGGEAARCGGVTTGQRGGSARSGSLRREAQWRLRLAPRATGSDE
jgi:hypothetical protein